MRKRAKQNSISEHGGAIAPPFPLPCGTFDFGSPQDSLPRPLSVERNGGVMPLAPLALTDENGLHGTIISLMKRFTPNELKWLIIDFTGSCAVFDQSLFGMCDNISSELAPLALAFLDEEAARRIEACELSSPNILLVINGGEPSDVEGLWLTAERLSRYEAARVYTLISPNTVCLPRSSDKVIWSEPFDESAARKITAAFRRGSI